MQGDIDMPRHLKTFLLVHPRDHLLKGLGFRVSSGGLGLKVGGAAMRASKAVVVGGHRLLVPRAPWTPDTLPVDHSLLSGSGLDDEERTQRASLKENDWVFAEEVLEDVCDALNPAPRVVFEATPSLEEEKDATLDLKDASESTPRVFAEEEVEVCNALNPAPRVVFEAAPSLEEAKDATLDLKDAFESVLNPSPENRAVSAMSKRVFDAFTLLQQSPEAQIVVASLASDPDIWDALLKNDKLMNFYESHQINFSPVSTVESIAENEVYSEASTVTLFLNKASSVTLKDRLMKMVMCVKMKISDISIKISDFFQDLMGTFTTEGSSEESDAKTLILSSFMALVIAVIFLILFKRIR